MKLDYEFLTKFCSDNWKNLSEDIKTNVNYIKRCECVMEHIEKPLIIRDKSVSLKKWMRSNTLLLDIYGGTYYLYFDRFFTERLLMKSTGSVFLKFRNASHPNNDFIKWCCKLILFNYIILDEEIMFVSGSCEVYLDPIGTIIPNPKRTSPNSHNDATLASLLTNTSKNISIPENSIINVVDSIDWHYVKFSKGAVTAMEASLTNMVLEAAAKTVGLVNFLDLITDIKPKLI